MTENDQIATAWQNLLAGRRGRAATEGNLPEKKSRLAKKLLIQWTQGLIEKADFKNKDLHTKDVLWALLSCLSMGTMQYFNT